MGIRFLCPNGHRLNVKSHLAGMRGICPDCDAKFMIPSESGGQVSAATPEQVAATAAAPIAQAAAPAPVAAESVATAVPAAAAPAPPPTPAPVTAPSNEVPVPPPAATPATNLPDMWYVQSGGQQFGPANVETFQAWVADGRVPADSLVWRSGWADWKSGSDALAELNLPTVSPTQQAAPDAAAAEVSTNSLPASNYQAKRRQRRDRARMVTLILGALVFLLLVVLVVVLARG